MLSSADVAKLNLFLLNFRREIIFANGRHKETHFGELGGVLGFVGTTPSSFLYLLSLPFLPFVSLSSPSQLRVKPIFVEAGCSHYTLM